MQAVPIGPAPERLISILVPLYNEEEFIAPLLARVLSAPLPAGYAREILVVDDGSTDGSAEAVEAVARLHPGTIRLLRLPSNRGKGYAVRRAIEEARGELAIIQDADLEYNPNEYLRLFEPLVEGVADVVYGSRFAASTRRRVLYYWHSVANGWLTWFCNVMADLNLTDIETCYKAFRTSLLKSIPLTNDRFGIEPEITIKVARRQARIFEVPVSYDGRTYEEGKKIGLLDAIEAFFVILRHGLSSDLYRDPGAEILDAFSGAPRFNAWMADVLRPYVGRRVLEIGAGMGNLSRALCPGRERYIASEVDAEHLARLRYRLRHRVSVETAACDLGRRDDFAPFEGLVDTVVCLNVLEHMEDDVACARHMHDVLEPGGVALILVPQGQGLYGRMDEVLGHHRRYSSEGLRKVLSQAGFQVERILPFNRISSPAWVLTGKLLRRRSPSRLLLRLFDRSVWLWRRLDGFLPAPPTSIIAVARKGNAQPAPAKKSNRTVTA